jgi:hypothetical protein
LGILNRLDAMVLVMGKYNVRNSLDPGFCVSRHPFEELNKSLDLRRRHDFVTGSMRLHPQFLLLFAAPAQHKIEIRSFQHDYCV